MCFGACFTHKKHDIYTHTQREVSVHLSPSPFYRHTHKNGFVCWYIFFANGGKKGAQISQSNTLTSPLHKPRAPQKTARHAKNTERVNAHCARVLRHPRPLKLRRASSCFFALPPFYFYFPIHTRAAHRKNGKCYTSVWKVGDSDVVRAL